MLCKQGVHLSDNNKNTEMRVGDNEMELVDFRIYKVENGKTYEGIYGINVAKVNEIIRLPKLTELPGSPDYVEGIFDLRGVVIPVINLAKWMHVDIPTDRKIKPRVVVAEFNNIVIGFIVHVAKRIRRINWKDIEPAHFSAGIDSVDASRITGVTRIEDDHVLLILDLESIVRDLGFYQPELSDDIDYNHFDGIALLLDDSAIARKICKDFLEKMGFIVAEAVDGEDGLEKLEKLYESYGDRLPSELKVIISDVEMPKIDGFHFAAKVKEDPRFSSIPIVFNSSISDEFVAAQSKQVGAETYLVKFDAQVFHREISRVVRQSQAKHL